MCQQRWAWMLGVCVLLVGCGGVAPARRGSGYAQTADSATSACLRNPACYGAAGEDAVLPWLSRAAGAARTASAALRLLSAEEVVRVEMVLVECAKEAHFQVNEREFGPGRLPTKKECEEPVKNPWGQEVKRAVELGRLKHELALECARQKLGEMAPGNFSVEPRYAYDLKTGRTRLITLEQVKEWLEAGWQHLLLGTLVPDVVLHATGNALKVQAVYDFKFPCLPSTPPQWNPYPGQHPYSGFNQSAMYRRALRPDDTALVSPSLGISR